MKEIVSMGLSKYGRIAGSGVPRRGPKATNSETRDSCATPKKSEGKGRAEKNAPKKTWNVAFLGQASAAYWKRKRERSIDNPTGMI